MVMFGKRKSVSGKVKALRLSIIVIVACSIVAMSGYAVCAEKKYGPGVTDTEIKIGQTASCNGQLFMS